jgi:hypothetical protein
VVLGRERLPPPRHLKEWLGAPTTQGGTAAGQIILVDYEGEAYANVKKTGAPYVYHESQGTWPTTGRVWPLSRSELIEGAKWRVELPPGAPHPIYEAVKFLSLHEYLESIGEEAAAFQEDDHAFQFGDDGAALDFSDDDGTPTSGDEGGEDRWSVSPAPASGDEGG